MDTKTLRASRAALVTQAGAILDKADTKKRALTADEVTTYDKLMLDVDAAKATIDRAEAFDREGRAIVPESQRTLPVEERAVTERLAAIKSFFRPTREDVEAGGKRTLALTFESREQRMARETREVELRAQGVGSASIGGALVPQGFSNRLEVALKFFGGMMRVSDVLTTDTGNDVPWPTVNDTTNVGAILAENATIPAQDIAFSSITLKAYMYTSKLIAVSWQLLQDSYFDIEGMVADMAGQRVGRILNTHFTTGTGTAQPNGVVTAASSGKVGLVGQTLTIIYDDLIDLIASVDLAYRPQSVFMMSDTAASIVRKLKDTQGHPLWQASLLIGQPDTLLGYPVVINNDVAVMAANAKSILFGDFSRYKVRRVKDLTLVRLNERYADNLQTGFFVFARFDGNLINAGTNPIKYYANSAT